MTDEEYARYSPWQQQALQNRFEQPRLNDYNQHPYEPCGPAMPIPTVHYALRLSDEDVARIADAVARGRPSWRKFWRGLGALLDFGPYRPL